MSAIEDLVVDRFFKDNSKRIEQWIEDFKIFNGSLPTFNDFYKNFPVTEGREEITVKIFVDELLEFLNGFEEGVVNYKIKQKMEMRFIGIVMTKGVDDDGHEPVGATGVLGSHSRTA